MQRRFSIAEKGWQASRQGGDRHCIAFVEGVQLAFWKGRAFGLAWRIRTRALNCHAQHTDFTQLT